MFKNIKIRNKIIFLTAIIIILFVTFISAYLVPLTLDMLRERTEVKLKELVEIPYGVIEKYYQLSREGNLSDEEAQGQALDQIRSMRYDGEVGYFWINDTKTPYPAMVMHPVSPQLEGLVLDDPKYNVAKGDVVNLFSAMVANTKDDGSGFVEYLWPKPTTEGVTIEQPKLSYVQRFEGWNWIVGTGIYIDDLKAIENSIFKSVLLTTGLLIGIAIFILLAIILPLNRSLKLIVNGTERYSQLDFSETIELDQKDEVGLIALAVNRVMRELKSLVSSIHVVSKTIHESGIAINKDMGVLNKTTEQTTSSATDVAALIEETASASETVQTIVEDAKQAIHTVAKKAMEGAEKVDLINQRAATIREGASTSSSNAESVYASSKDKLESAIGSMGVVVQIHELLKSILQITSQTNLLALNASIEAARAGESGRGFAVVAGEIGKLADSSSSLVAQIQETVKAIDEAVSSLIDNSSGLLGFFEQTVLLDYQKMRDIGNQYTGDAEVLNAMMMDLSATAQQLASSMDSVSESVNEVAEASHEGAESVVGILELTNKVSNSSEDISKNTEVNVKVIQELDTLLSKFKGL